MLAMVKPWWIMDIYCMPQSYEMMLKLRSEASLKGKKYHGLNDQPRNPTTIQKPTSKECPRYYYMEERISIMPNFLIH